MLGRKDRKTPLQKEINDELEALRDDCIALFLNSRMTMEQVHARGGPTPQTISRWLYKQTKFPQLRTIQSFVIALGYRVAIIDSLMTMPRYKAEHRLKPKGKKK